MSFLCNNFAVVYLALVSALLAWLYGGTRGDLLVPLVPWLMVFMVEVLFCFPQKHAGETTFTARKNTLMRMKGDPLVWLTVGLLVLLAIPLFNPGLCPYCDAEKIALGADPSPAFGFLPSCVDIGDHLTVFCWFVVALTSMVATRHCLNHRGKKRLLEILVWNGAILAVLGFVEAATSAPGPFWIGGTGKSAAKVGSYFASFGYPNMAGDYFTTMFALSVGLWRYRFDEVREDLMRDQEHFESKLRGIFWRQNYLLIPALICFFAALNTLSRSAILMVTALAAVFFLHTFVVLLSRMRRVKRVKSGAWCLLILGAIVFSAYVFTPDSLQKEVDTLDTVGMLDRVAGKGQYHVSVATRLWHDHVLFGCGGWGYQHLGQSKMTPDEKKNLQGVGGANVHNDWLQFLTEHGVLGFGAMVMIVLLLLVPIYRVWKALVTAARFSKSKSRPPKPTQIFVIPAPVFCILMAAVASFIHGFADCPFRSPAVLTLFLVMLAAAEGFLPNLDELRE